MRKEQFEEGYYYHIYNRGVDKRLIFLNDQDRTRFIHSLYVLNNFLDIPRFFNIYTLQPANLLVPIQPYVEIVAGCLMGSHYHLMLTPKKKDGVSLFLHKVGTSYTKYFNIKYERSGSLFEGAFRAKFVDQQSYADYLTQYIHLNPVKKQQDSQAKLGNDVLLEEAIKYRWSTLSDYLGGVSEFSVAISSSFRDEVLGMDVEEYRKFIQDACTDYSQAKLGRLS